MTVHVDQPELHLLSQGATAVKSGLIGGNELEAVFDAYQVPCVEDDPSYHLPSFLPRPQEQLLIHQQDTIDFYLYKDFARELDLCVCYRRQEGKGTADLKLNGVVDKLTELANGRCFWVVLNGDYFRPQVVETNRTKIAKAGGRLIVNKGPFLRRAVEGLVLRGFR